MKHSESTRERRPGKVALPVPVAWLVLLGMVAIAWWVALAVAVASGREGAGGPLHAFAVRKTAKAHGLGRRIEGNFAAGQTVVVVDDVITTGGSTLQAIEAVDAEGGTVAFVMALVDREEGGRAAIEARGVPVYALATKSQLRALEA
jgi:orotate phosphoribosyltransferase